MTLDEAIKHAEEIAEENQRVVDTKDVTIDMLFCDDEEIEEHLANYQKRAEDYRQLAKWLRDYKRLKEQEPCEDAISRRAVLEYIKGSEADLWHDSENELVRQDIKELPPAIPQPKTGRWIVDSATSSQIGIHGKKTFSYEVHCDKCRWKWAYATDKKDSIPSNYCPNCGTKMIEPQESEG